ncbi:hypothetical protein EVAR_78834_1 [Eumeta japonica]|uniref:Uncharacterized protein n=1 Tax=Eumeta variegata TaxID=151549 RepID=A0A4C1Z990_EUMVA|nr:hypothetical protein EVAR_78834_1 [Eumeta japonica]
MLPQERAAHRSALAILKRLSRNSYSTYSLRFDAVSGGDSASSRPPGSRGMSLRDDEYVHVRSLIASIHRPKNVARPPELAPPNSPASERGSPASSDTDRSGTGSDLSDIRTKDEVVHAPRSKSNSIAGTSLAPPGPGQQEERRRRRPSLLHLQTERGGPTGPQSAGPYLTVPRFTVTAPPGEQHHRRFSHAFHGFALRRHSNTVRHLSIDNVAFY